MRYIIFLNPGLCSVSIHHRLLKLGLERLSIELRSIQVDTVNLPRIADILQRIRGQHNKIGALTFGKHPSVLDPEHFSRPGRGSYNDVRRSHSQSHVHSDLMVFGKSVRILGGNPGVGSEHNSSTAAMYFGKLYLRFSSRWA